jgi:hypothetical protein
MSPGIDSVLKEICQKLSNVETKLTKLDKIEVRLESMDKKFKTVDTEINSCKQRLNTLLILALMLYAHLVHLIRTERCVQAY